MKTLFDHFIETIFWCVAVITMLTLMVFIFTLDFEQLLTLLFR